MAKKKQRGKTASSLNTAESPKKTETFALLLDESDDEAPEAVTFEDSKAEALSCMKHALDSARREKELLKEKRRRRQQLFQEQKKRKLLPADVLEEIDSAPSKKQSLDEGADEETGDDEDEEAEETRNTKPVDVRNLKGNYTVTTAAREQEAASFQRRAAEDFLRSRLYGPGSCRTTSNELLSLQNKKGSNKSAAVQFVKKNWASKEKAKAEKMKKRWIHKQQLPSS